jgi:hypothetical protein
MAGGVVFCWVMVHWDGAGGCLIFFFFLFVLGAGIFRFIYFLFVDTLSLSLRPLFHCFLSKYTRLCLLVFWSFLFYRATDLFLDFLQPFLRLGRQMEGWADE